MACSRVMKLTCSAVERVSAAGSHLRYSQGNGSNRKHSGQWNSNIVIPYPAAQLPEQRLSLRGAELDLGPIQVGSQGLQGTALHLRVAAAQVVQPSFAIQTGGGLIATLFEQLLEPGI